MMPCGDITDKKDAVILPPSKSQPRECYHSLVNGWNWRTLF
jgi:hypothetical protein